jgi:hypothetical protein
VFITTAVPLRTEALDDTSGSLAGILENWIATHTQDIEPNSCYGSEHQNRNSAVLL